jgi:hypothetical protein
MVLSVMGMFQKPIRRKCSKVALQPLFSDLQPGPKECAENDDEQSSCLANNNYLGRKKRQENSRRINHGRDLG